MITLKIKGKEYTLEEAQTLYEELDKIFGRDRNEYWPTWPTYPTYPRPDQPEWPQFPTIICDPALPENTWYTVTTPNTYPNGRPSDISLGMTATEA